MPKSAHTDSLTVAVPVETNEKTEPTVRIFIPEQAESGSGLKMDPYEHVTINGETTYVLRGEYVDVSIPVFMILKDRYPNL